LRITGSLGALVLIVAVGAAIWFSAGLSSAGSGDIVVDSVSDGADPTPANGDCDDGSGSCTLRAAIQTANGVAGKDTIVFEIDGAGPHTIAPASPLPDITDPVVIDGLTQSGAAANTLGPKEGTNAVLLIELDGSNAGPDADGLVVTGGDSTVRGLVINRFGGSGVLLEQGEANTSGSRNRLQGNFLGTDVSGTVAMGNENGVKIADSWWNLIGGTNPSDNNLISGNGVGILITGNSTFTDVQGSIIGAARDGDSDLGNDSHGVFLSDGAFDNTIGAPQLPAENIIAFNGGDAVALSEDAGVDNYIDPNEMHSNGGLGIDLNDDGVTLNDDGDIDSGPNDLYNYPVVTSAETSNPPGSIVIEGILDATPNTFVNIFLFSNTECDPSGHGEGRLFLWEESVATDGDGHVGFSVPIAEVVAPGEFITASASNPQSTSEFSPCLLVTSSGAVRLQGDVDCDDDVDSVDGLGQLRHVAGLGVNQQPGCPLVGSDFGGIFADVDCDDDVDSVDALKVLRHIAAFPVSQTEPCANIETPL
jgi:CSLREA domain-containing protein